MKPIWLIVTVIMTVSLQAGWFSPEKKLVVRHAPPMDVSYEKPEAMSLLNEIREAMGMNTLVHNEQLAQAAQAHADYLVKNRITSHDEIPGRPGFTGRTPSERALHAGYLSTQVSENLSTKNRDARSSIDGLFSAIYHRFGFLDVGIDEIGVGATQDVHHTENSAFVYVMGNSYLNALCHEHAFKGYGRYVYGVCRDKRHRIAQKRFLEAQDANRRYNPKIVCYPYDGQKDVPPSFYDEMPDPLPDYEVSGFPVSVTFNAYFFKRVELVSFTLTRSDGKPVDPYGYSAPKTTRTDASHLISSHSFLSVGLSAIPSIERRSSIKSRGERCVEVGVSIHENSPNRCCVSPNKRRLSRSGCTKVICSI